MLLAEFALSAQPHDVYLLVSVVELIQVGIDAMFRLLFAWKN